MITRVFIFDLGGTLVDTNELLATAWERAFRGRGLNVDAEQVLPHLGQDARALPNAVLRVPLDTARAEDLRQRAAREYRELLPGSSVRLMPGAFEVTRALRSRGLRTAIATAGGTEDLDALSCACGIDLPALVDHVLLWPEEAGRRADDAGPLGTALERLGVPAGWAAVVGDAPSDVAAACRVGARGYGVLTGEHDDDAFLAAGAQRVYLDLRAMADDLDRTIAADSEELNVWMPL